MPETTEAVGAGDKASQSVRGRFVWYDLMTTDVNAAASFYGSVVGWTAKDSGMPGQSYTLLSAGNNVVGGLMPIPEHAVRATPSWMGYIGVDDVDAFTRELKTAGGAVHREPQDIPGVGRFSVVADPQGAGFVLFTPQPGSQGGPEAPPNTPGHIGWHELHSENGEKALEFYTGMFGWTKASDFNMGDFGVYHIFATGGAPLGGMMTKAPQFSRPPMWLYYFNVEAIDAAVERVQAGGGRIVHAPTEVPGGSWIVQGIDPQGAMFALVAAKR